MAINQGHSHGKGLGHPHQGIIDRRIPVGVIFPQHFPHHPGTFPERTIGGKTQLVHGIENTTVYGLKPIPRIRQGPTHNHAHGVLQVGSGHFIAEVS